MDRTKSDALMMKSKGVGPVDGVHLQNDGSSPCGSHTSPKADPEEESLEEVLSELDADVGLEENSSSSVTDSHSPMPAASSTGQSEKQKSNGQMNSHMGGVCDAPILLSPSCLYTVCWVSLTTTQLSAG